MLFVIGFAKAVLLWQSDAATMKNLGVFLGFVIMACGMMSRTKSLPCDQTQKMALP